MKKYTIIALIAFAFLQLRSGNKTQQRIEKKSPSEIKTENLDKVISNVKRQVIENSISKKEEILTKHSEIRTKAISSSEDKLKLDEYFTNSKNIRLAYLVLNSSNFENLDKTIDRRIDATNFLIEGLKRKNVDRSELVKATEMFLLSDLEEKTNDVEKRRAIVGDKVELYHALVKFAPKDAQRFKENYMSKRLQRVIKYVELNIKRENRG